nr:mytilus inhibitory peptide [Mytilus edulis]
ASHIPRFV